MAVLLRGLVPGSSRCTQLRTDHQRGRDPAYVSGGQGRGHGDQTVLLRRALNPIEQGKYFFPVHLSTHSRRTACRPLLSVVGQAPRCLTNAAGLCPVFESKDAAQRREKTVKAVVAEIEAASTASCQPGEGHQFSYRYKNSISNVVRVSFS